MAVPWTLLFASAATVYTGLRTFVRPYRGAVMQHGAVTGCAGGQTCSRLLTARALDSDVVLSPVEGRVVHVAGRQLSIASDDDPVVLTYQGLDPAVREGERVRSGQNVGRATELGFGVSRIERAANGAITYQPLEPASYLAARGLRVSGRRVAPSTDLWCAAGRRLTVPEQIGRCRIKLPDPARFALLPVSVTME